VKRPTEAKHARNEAEEVNEKFIIIGGQSSTGYAR
jgi:hypothetical protein